MSYRDDQKQYEHERYLETVGEVERLKGIAARADTRIAELESALTVRDTEIARLEADLELARIGDRRYEVARRMNLRQWGDAHSLNLLTGKPLDQIIDELRPFYFPARAGNGGGV